MLGVTANVLVRFIMYVRRNRSTGPPFDIRRCSDDGPRWQLVVVQNCLPVILTVKTINHTPFIVSKRKHNGTQQSGKCTP